MSDLHSDALAAWPQRLGGGCYCLPGFLEIKPLVNFGQVQVSLAVVSLRQTALGLLFGPAPTAVMNRLKIPLAMTRFYGRGLGTVP